MRRWRKIERYRRRNIPGTPTGYKDKHGRELSVGCDVLVDGCCPCVVLYAYSDGTVQGDYAAMRFLGKEPRDKYDPSQYHKVDLWFEFCQRGVPIDCIEIVRE